MFLSSFRIPLESPHECVRVPPHHRGVLAEGLSASAPPRVPKNVNIRRSISHALCLTDVVYCLGLCADRLANVIPNILVEGDGREDDMMKGGGVLYGRVGGHPTTLLHHSTECLRPSLVGRDAEARNDMGFFFEPGDLLVESEDDDFCFIIRKYF